MKIESALINVEGVELRFPEIPLVDLIAELFKIYGTSLEIKLPESKREEFVRAAAKEWHTTKTDLPQVDYINLSVAKDTFYYFKIQHGMKAFNDYVLSLNPSPAPELFTGTTDALNDLTIRKDENTAL